MQNQRKQRAAAVKDDTASKTASKASRSKATTLRTRPAAVDMQLAAAEHAVQKAAALAKGRDWTALMALAHGLVQRAPEHARRVVVAAWAELEALSLADRSIFGPELLRAEIWACERMGLKRETKAAQKRLDALVKAPIARPAARRRR